MSQIFESISQGEIQLKAYLIATLFAFLCGAIISAVCAFETNISKSFLISLILLPAIVETVIIMVNGNVGTGIAVAGAFSLVRFRSVPGKAKEIAAIFAAMTAGLSCAAGYVAIALLFSLIVALAMLISMQIPLKSESEYELCITVPESLNSFDAFDSAFKEHTKSHRLIRIKTTNMGSLYKLYYKTVLKKPDNIKVFTDELRCRNGNLEIKISASSEGGDEL